MRQLLAEGTRASTTTANLLCPREGKVLRHRDIQEPYAARFCCKATIKSPHERDKGSLARPQELREQVLGAAGHRVVVVDLRVLVARDVAPGADADDRDAHLTAEAQRLVALAHRNVEIERREVRVWQPLPARHSLAYRLIRLDLGDDAAVVFR